MCVTEVSKQPFRCCRSVIPKSYCTPLSPESRGRFCTPVFSVSSRDEHPKVTGKGELHPKRPLCQPGVTARAFCFLICCHPTPAPMHRRTTNHSIVWPFRFSASTRSKVPSSSSTTTPDPTSPTSPARSCLTWSRELSSTHRAAQPCTFPILSVPVPEQQSAIQKLLQRRWPESVDQKILGF